MSSFPQISLTSLPLEVIEQIASYLSGNDLIACSLVSIGWREIFNNNVFWVKKCKGGYGWKIYAEHLENLECLVEPQFVLPQSIEKTLQPLCKWRVYFMAQIHLERNWRTNTNKVYTTDGTFNTEGSICYEEENVVVMFSGTNACEIWNTEESPYLEDVIFCAINEVNPFIYFFKNFMLIVQLNLIQVYEKTDDKYKLFYRRLFDENEKFDVPPSIAIMQWYWAIIHNKLIPMEAFKQYTSCKGTACFENIFIGYNGMSDSMNGFFNIWDLETGIKLKEEKFTDLPNLLSDIQFYKTKESVYVVFKIEDPIETKTTILGYNPLTQNYTNFCIEIISNYCRHFYFDNNYIVALHSNIIEIWDTKTNSKKTTYKDLDLKPLPYTLIVHNSQIIYSGHGEFATHLTIIDISTLQKIKTFIVTHQICGLTSLEGNLVLMKCNTTDVNNFRTDFPEYEISIWNLDCYRKIFTFKAIGQFSCHVKFTKLICIQSDEMSIVHFW